MSPLSSDFLHNPDPTLGFVMPNRKVAPAIKGLPKGLEDHVFKQHEEDGFEKGFIMLDRHQPKQNNSKRPFEPTHPLLDKLGNMFRPNKKQR